MTPLGIASLNLPKNGTTLFLVIRQNALNFKCVTEDLTVVTKVNDAVKSE